MAFWGLLVILAFVGVFFVNSIMEQISDQMLMLLGISGATGLGAVIIGETKNAAKAKKSLAWKLKHQRSCTNKTIILQPRKILLVLSKFHKKLKRSGIRLQNQPDPFGGTFVMTVMA